MAIPASTTDYMSRLMDEELGQLEEMLTALYANATNKVTAEFYNYSKKIGPDLKAWQEMLEKGLISETEYQTRVRNKIFKSLLYNSTVKMLTNTLVSTDQAAMAIVRGELPYVIAQSYNFVQSLGWKAADEAGMSVGTFQIYNARAVQKLIKDNPRLLPKVDLPKDQQWNQAHINNVITQGIIQGHDIPTIANNLQTVAKMDEHTAVRTARTSMTYAENLGRDESFINLKKKGLPVRKKWSAVIDERTRDTHRLLNGTYANEDGLFGEGILVHLLRCPADPTGDAWEIYNCRCREGVVFDNSIIDHSKDDEAYEEFLKANYPDDYEKLKSKDYFNKHTSKPQANNGTNKPKTGTTTQKKTAKKAESAKNQQKQGELPDHKTANTRKEATSLLKEMGFGSVSSGVNNIDEKLYVDNVNRLSALNTRFNAVTKGMKFTTGRMNSIAYVQHQYGIAGSTQLKLSTEYFKGTSNALIGAAKGATAAWKEGKQGFWMPISSENETLSSITHEYGHILQNMLLNTQAVATKYNNNRYSINGVLAVKTAITEGRKAHKDEIIAIAKEIDKDFDLEKNLSKYGHKNTAEFFAECFMNAFCGEPNILGQAMLIWLERQGL